MSISIAHHDTLLRVAFGSVTNAYASLGALKDSFALIILNSLDKEISLSLDGTNAWLNLDAGESPVLNYNAMGKIFPATGVWVKYVGAAPTVGSLRITSILRKAPN